MSDEPEWTPDPAVTAAAMARIDASHSAWPACRLCGQKVGQLDKYGLCSKTSQPHQDWRSTVSADRKGRPA